ncbi:MAG: diguanylate cyclase response regulator [Candidatus Nomurabacteria bacterium]|nr:diguanylate cyclase response regulator [Candidatus Nomurabacteria bacterium]
MDNFEVKPKVIFIDDRPDVVAGRAKILEGMGYLVQIYSTSGQALEAVHDLNDPTIVFVDMDMGPGEATGVQIVAYWDENHRAPLTIWAYTADSTSKTETRFRRAGADGVVSKTCDFDTFMGVMYSAIRFLRKEQRATRDKLTQIPNRDEGFIRGEKLLDVAQREEKPLIGIMFDLDDFKSYNTKYTHPRADRILVHVVRMAKAHLRKADEFFRYGGEEFVVLCHDAPDIDFALNLEEALNTALLTTLTDLGGGDHDTCCVTFGICLISKDVEGSEYTMSYLVDQTAVSLRERKKTKYDRKDALLKKIKEAAREL